MKTTMLTIKRNYLQLLVLSFISLIGLSSCSNDSDEETISEEDLNVALITSEDDALATEEFSSITEFVLDEASYINTANKYTQKSENLPACVTVTYTGESNTLLIDFGTEGCEGNDGLTRKGIIKVVFSKELRTPGAHAKISLENYMVEGFAITGSKSITNVTETEGMESFNIAVSDASITGPNGRTRNWNSDYTLTRIEGAETVRPYDNIYETTGSASGIDRNGNSFTRTITVPLIKDRKIGCLRNYVSGEVTIENSAASSPFIIDFGDGTCDRRATVTYNGNTREIFLR
ncbi:hypothetical protein HX109_00970 [Galbibacter sp. BG1]|uniref:hypothetical protein n=1 Tax=Galbibacter sp. BG1 TaxID=1170699 RepID=UPI0015BDC841|nr:hypothetical protein [Galbibacter sp. BG1]QLE00201.1 hypothetical protein HX109_00970 [Galbibacter sp. BG1]